MDDSTADGMTRSADGGAAAAVAPERAGPEEADRVTLHKLGDTDLTVADPAEDIRGRKVRDKNGEEVGEVDELFIDGPEHKVRFLQIASGGFLGIGVEKTLIPVDVITRITEDTVFIDQTREHVAGAPRYDPALTEGPDWRDYYGYYGYGPFWGDGYVYPRYPFFV